MAMAEAAVPVGWCGYCQRVVVVAGVRGVVGARGETGGVGSCVDCGVGVEGVVRVSEGELEGLGLFAAGSEAAPGALGGCGCGTGGAAEGGGPGPGAGSGGCDATRCSVRAVADGRVGQLS